MPKGSGSTPRVLPFIRDLNPQIDDFSGLLELIKKHEGKKPDLIDAIFKKWTKDKKRKKFSVHSIGANTVTSLSEENLGIIDSTTHLTPLGKALYRKRNAPAQLKELLGTHLLQHRAGWQFARALDVLRRRGGRKPKREDIAEYLGEKYGLQEWRDLNNISSLHSFLEWCGVVSNYQLNQAEFERLLGAPVGDVAVLERFTIATRAYLQALVSLGGTATGGEMRQAAEAYLRRHLNPHQLGVLVEPLVDANLATAPKGRGDKTAKYVLVDKEKSAILAELSAELSVIGAVPDEVFEHDFAWVVKRLGDNTLTRDEKGRTLETLAAMIFWRLGLRHVLIRERTEFEVDVVAEFLGSGYQTWSAQCKAFGGESRAQVRGSHILREFGIAVLDHYSVLMFVTTAGFTPDAVSIAERVMEQSPVQVLMLDGKDLAAIAKDDSALFEIVASRSEDVRRIRVGDPPWVIFKEFDAVRDMILKDQPLAEELWLYLERRDFNTSQPLVAALLYAWLESQREAPGFDPDYLARVAASRAS